VVRQTFEFLSNQAGANRIALTTALAPQALWVRGDAIQLQQVILNLVMNAVDAIRSADSNERTITGRTTPIDETSAEVAIEDSGPGISLDQAEKIFEPFFSTKNAGMGMGLSIARRIVASHRGRIWAKNRPEGGAVFRFTVPLAYRNDRERDLHSIVNPE
jgi:signal transduction histidine kinase